MTSNVMLFPGSDGTFEKQLDLLRGLHVDYTIIFLERKSTFCLLFFSWFVYVTISLYLFVIIWKMLKRSFYRPQIARKLLSRFRSSCWQMFFKIDVLKNFVIFTRKLFVLESLKACNFIKKDSETGVFMWILQNF